MRVTSISVTGLFIIHMLFLTVMNYHCVILIIWMKNSRNRIFTFGRSLTQVNYTNPVKMKSGIQRLSLVFILTILFGAFTIAQTPINEATRTAKVPPRWPGCAPEMSDCTKSKLDEFVAA